LNHKGFGKQDKETWEFNLAGVSDDLFQDILRWNCYFWLTHKVLSIFLFVLAFWKLA